MRSHLLKFLRLKGSFSSTGAAVSASASPSAAAAGVVASVDSLESVNAEREEWKSLCEEKADAPVRGALSALVDHSALTESEAAMVW